MLEIILFYTESVTAVEIQMATTVVSSIFLFVSFFFRSIVRLSSFPSRFLVSDISVPHGWCACMGLYVCVHEWMSE